MSSCTDSYVYVKTCMAIGCLILSMPILLSLTIITLDSLFIFIKAAIKVIFKT